jgi:hypothetical protein
MREALFGATSYYADEEPPQHQSQGSAEQEDQTPHGVKHNGQDENHETKQRKKEEAELKLKARVLIFQFFICDEGRQEDQIKRPTHPKGAAAEVKDHKSAQQPAEEELQEIDEPRVELRSPHFPFVIDIRLTIHPKDAECNDQEMNDHPEVLPEHVYAFQGDSVEDKAADE